MATFDYARARAMAERLIAKFGQIGSVKRMSSPDPVYGGDGTETAYTAKLVPMAYKVNEIDGTVILNGDVQLYISSVDLAITPIPGDLTDCNGKSYRIIKSDPNLYDGVTPVVHICQARISS